MSRRSAIIKCWKRKRINNESKKEIEMTEM